MKYLLGTISGRLYALVGFFILSLIVLSVYQLVNLDRNLMKFKRHEIQSVVDAAYNVTNLFYTKVQSGELTQEEGQLAAKNALRGMRYQGSDYVFVYDHQGVSLVHPMKPAHENTNMMQERDANGKYHIRSFIEQALQNGEDYVDYVYVDTSGKNRDKLSFVKNFAPWGWVLGSGVLFDEVIDAFWAAAFTSALLALFLLLVAGSFGVLLARSIARPIAVLNKDIARITSNELEQPVSGQERRDEIGVMCRAFEDFRSGAIERRKLLAQEKENDVENKRKAERTEELIAIFRESVSQNLKAVDTQVVEMGARS